MHPLILGGTLGIWEGLLPFSSVVTNDLATKEAVGICPSKQIATALYMLIMFFYSDEVMQIASGRLLAHLPKVWVEQVND